MSSLTSKTFMGLPLEDSLMFLSTIFAGFATFAMGQPFAHSALIALIFGAGSKAVLSFGNGVNFGDAILALSAFASLLSVSVLSNPSLAVYSLVLGAVAKGLTNIASNHSSLEDILLVSVPVITAVVGLPQFANSATLQQVGLLVGFFSKSLAGQSAGASSAAPAPVASAAPAASA